MKSPQPAFTPLRLRLVPGNGCWCRVQELMYLKFNAGDSEINVQASLEHTKLVDLGNYFGGHVTVLMMSDERMASHAWVPTSVLSMRLVSVPPDT